MDFQYTYSCYEVLLKKMKRIGTIYSFDSINLGSNGFLLRHDVDFDLNAAYKIHQIERAENVRSTFFVLTTSDSYNLNTEKNRELLKEIASFSEIGLHFDPTCYNTDDYETLASYVDHEAKMIEKITGIKVKSISLHNPSIHNQYPIFEGFNNAYSSTYFKSDSYISDSSKNFRNKDIFQFIENGNHQMIQVLLHPIHYSTSENIYAEYFCDMFEREIERLDDLMRHNETYNNEMNNVALLDFFKKRGRHE
ncbi:polysaccharide deacetylase family protein [Fusibacter bizertensis]